MIAPPLIISSDEASFRVAVHHRVLLCAYVKLSTLLVRVHFIGVSNSIAIYSFTCPRAASSASAIRCFCCSVVFRGGVLSTATGEEGDKCIGGGEGA